MSAAVKPLGQWMEAKSGDRFYRRYELANGDKVNGFCKAREEPEKRRAGVWRKQREGAASLS